MESRDYIKALIQSLKKKVGILQDIRKINEEQRELLSEEEPSLEEWDSLTDRKGKLIEEINFLDDGFAEVYEHVREEITTNKNEYRSEILTMQELISTLTALSVDIKAEEIRNKEAAQLQFAKLKKKGKSLAKSNRAANLYKNSMKRMNLIDPQFMDKKN